MARIASSTGKRRGWIDDWLAPLMTNMVEEELNHLGAWFTGFCDLTPFPCISMLQDRT